MNMIVLILSAALLAAGDAPAGGAKVVLSDMEQKWVEALVKADVATLDSIFADSYVDTDEEGHVGGKEDVLVALKSGELKMKSIKLSDLKVHEYGNAAVVTGVGAQAGTFQGQSIAPKVVFTDTFVKQQGKWRAVASHRSQVKGK